MVFSVQRCRAVTWARSETMTYLRDSPDVLIPVLLAETQVLIQTESHIVTVQSVCSQAKLEEVLLERSRDGRLAGCGQTSEPEREALLLAELIALGAGQGGVPVDVAEDVVSCVRGEVVVIRNTEAILRGHCDLFDRSSEEREVLRLSRRQQYLR